VGGCNYIPRPGIILASSFGYKAKCASIYSIDVAEVDPWERPGGGAVFTQNTSYQHQQHTAHAQKTERSDEIEVEREERTSSDGVPLLHKPVLHFPPAGAAAARTHGSGRRA